jgi:hypothetical protein
MGGTYDTEAPVKFNIEYGAFPEDAREVLHEIDYQKTENDRVIRAG